MTYTKRQAEAVRTLAALPDDDWQPHDWDSFLEAVRVLEDELRRYDRMKARKAVKPKRVKDIPPAAREALRERSNGVCEVNDLHVCGTPARHRATVVHHVAGRGGKDPHRLSNLLHVCQGAHLMIHLHPSDSYARGWMVKRNGVGG